MRIRDAAIRRAFTVNLGTDRANIGSGPAQRPDCQRRSERRRSAGPRAHGSTRACFRLPAPFTFGNSGRNAVFAPGYANVDAACKRTCRCGTAHESSCAGRSSISFNRVNFDVPNRISVTPNFGRIFSANRPADAVRDQNQLLNAKPVGRPLGRLHKRATEASLRSPSW